MKIRSVGVCLKEGQPQAAGIVRSLVKWLSEQGFEAVLDAESAAMAGLPPHSHRELAGPRRSDRGVGGRWVAAGGGARDGDATGSPSWA